ncbi:MAG: FAD linked oxidase-like protein [candidate division Zixibacteria bacterium SM23_81]|nr:MAG: FAD linked oxidase-like protein [candidate division Zixibacteria bacterium SM23_81]
MKPEVIKELNEIFGEDRCKTNPSDVYVYGFDAGIHRSMPDAVVRPMNVQEVQKLVLLANKHKVPIIPRGAGTALCGHSVPIDGGIVVDMQGMNKIKEIKVTDLYCVVEPGVVCDHLNAALKPYKFFIPGPASSEAATLGGMMACNASGAKAAKYGATRDYVLGCEAVLPTGEIVHLGGRCLKNASGYQLDRLLVGSEGTLGVVTEIILKVAPLPAKKAAVVPYFDTLRQAGEVVAKIIAEPILPSQLEIMSQTCIQAVNKATGMCLQECAAILLIELDGHPAAVIDEVKVVRRICEELGALDIDYTEDESRIAELWKGRKQMIPSLSSLKEEYATVMLADDMAVPMSKVPDALEAFQEISDRYDIIIPSYGHAADGNLHTKVLMDPTNPDHWKQAEKAVTEVFEAVLRLGGTITGEHGVGITKAPYLFIERSEAIGALKAIKRALDPNNIMNPHKIQEWEEGFVTHLRYPVEAS